MQYARVLAMTMVCAGCTLPPFYTSDPADLEIVAGPYSQVTARVNYNGDGTASPGPMPFAWDIWAFNYNNHTDFPPWFWRQDYSYQAAGCGSDGFMLYRPATGVLYGEGVHATNGVGDGWCWGTSPDMGVTWTWHVEPETNPDGGRLAFSDAGLTIADAGPEHPVHIVTETSSTRYTVPTSCRRAVRNAEEGAASFVVGIGPGPSWVLSRLWAGGRIDTADFTSNGIIIPARDPPLARNGGQLVPMNFCLGLNDAWLDRAHNILWLAVTQACSRDATHPCVGFYGLVNLAPPFTVASWDDGSVFTPAVAYSGQTDNYTPSLLDGLDVWAPRITTDDVGNVLFDATISGPSLFASQVVGGLNIATGLTTLSIVPPVGQFAYVTGRNFDFNGISPDPTDRSYAWALGSRVVGTINNNMDKVEAIAVHFGRKCNPQTWTCS